jgi:hypothetical protein
MITLHGPEWGTAAMVRRWATRDGLREVTVPGPGHGEVRFSLDQAAAIERDKRLSTRGRPRRLDIAAALP